MMTFQLFLTKCIEDVIITNTNHEGIRVYKEQLKPMDYMEPQAYIGLLILAGVYKSHDEAMETCGTRDISGIFSIWQCQWSVLRLFQE